MNFNPFKGMKQKEALKLKNKILDDLGIDPNEKRLIPKEIVERELDKLNEYQRQFSIIDQEIEAIYDTKTMNLKDQSGTPEEVDNRKIEGSTKVKKWLKLSQQIDILKEISQNLEKLKSGGVVESKDRQGIITRHGMKEYGKMLEDLS